LEAVITRGAIQRVCVGCALRLPLCKEIEEKIGVG